MIMKRAAVVELLAFRAESGRTRRVSVEGRDFYSLSYRYDGKVLLKTEEGEVSGIPVSMAFICYNDDGTAYVWAEDRGKLEKRTVTLGEMNDMTGTVEVLEGLTEEDYIAFPDGELCVEGAPTTRDQVAQETQGQEAEVS